MEENHIPGIWGVDTREITRKIRDNGSSRVILTNADVPTEKAIEIIKNTPVATNAVEKVSCKKRWYSRTTNAKYNVVAIDCGIKLNIIRLLNARGCNVTVVPFNTSANEIIKMNPDGVVVSNGPGNPEDVASIIDVLKELKGKFPIFGIGLGNLVLAAAYGAKSDKLKFGHHGGNHPVMNVETGKVITVSQSQDYTLNEESLKSTELKIILPIYSENHFKHIIELLNESKVKNLELLVNDKILSSIKSNDDLNKNLMKNKKVKVKCSENNLKLFLTCSDNFMSLSLFFKDGLYDDSQILIGKDKNAMKWALNLFKFFSD
jgi:carbamoyl-phosphate synthase small subunit